MENYDYKLSCIKEIYGQLDHYIVIGLTGRCGSGCSTTRDILCSENQYDPKDYMGSDHMRNLTNDDRDQEIILNFSKNNKLLPFKVIKVRDILTTFILENIDGFFEMLNEVYPSGGDGKAIKNDLYYYFKENSSIYKTSNNENPFDKAVKECKEIWGLINDNVNKFIENISKIQYDFLFEYLGHISETIRKFLIEKIDKDAYTIVYQNIGNIIRTYGSLSQERIKAGPSAENIHAIACRINLLIKIFRREDWIRNNFGEKRESIKKSTVHIVIDSIKNVFEANYLKSRYHSFFLVALTLDDINRIKRLKVNKGLDEEQIELIDTREQPSKAKDFIKRIEKKDIDKKTLVYKTLFEDKNEYNRLFWSSHKDGTYMFNLQDVDGCIQNADILINNVGSKEDLKLKIMRYVCLMMHPGLVPPTIDEKCMQIAQAAKLNSGCISRQVGAVVSDKDGNVLSIGWNDPSTTHENECISCIRRSFSNLLQMEDDIAYSYYELYNPDFRSYIVNIVKGNFEHKYVANLDDQELIKMFLAFTNPRINGLPLAYCFKDIYTKMTGDRNQVHTRAQHGEEKALEGCTKEQTAGGTLYTTSSSCELCAKKALSYDIRRIVYIEPYSGITNDHILGHSVQNGIKVKRGKLIRTEPMSIELFTGATQKAYVQLYSPVFPLKDELLLRGISLR